MFPGRLYPQLKRQDVTEEVGQSLLESKKEKKIMSKFMTLTKANINSALVYFVLFALLDMALYVKSVGSVFNVDWRALVDAGFFGGLAFLISVLKNLLTTQDGKFLGITQVIPSTPDEDAY